MIKDEDAVDMLSTNMEKYFDRARGARIRKMFDYTINLEPNLTEEYVKAGFPGATDGKYYLIDEELKFSVKCLGYGRGDSRRSRRAQALYSAARISGYRSG